LLALVSAPAFRDATDDGFPFSTYPMFARPRTKVSLWFTEGVTRDGRSVRLPPRLVANQEAMQAMKTIGRAARGGPGTTQQLCRRVAERVATDPAFTEVQRVQIVLARFDALQYFSGKSEAETREVAGQCRVRR